MKSHFRIIGLITTVFVSGCIKTIKERQVTSSYSDVGVSLRMSASIDKEIAQQFRYHLFPASYLFLWFPPLCLGNEWEILRKEVLFYRWNDLDAGICEEREILVETTNAQFMRVGAEKLQQKQSMVYQYIIGKIDDARYEAKKSEAEEVTEAEEIVLAHEVDSNDEVLDSNDNVEKELCVITGDEALVGKLIKMQYTSELADLPICNDLEVIQLIGPEARFKVRIARHFIASKTGRALGTINETYLLHKEQLLGDGVCHTLLK